jgi:MerR family mercuric resistance operon transcriptional regulator
MSRMTIGRVAGAAGVNVETIRFYQRIGLVKEPDKPVGGIRRYPEETVHRVGFIKRAQQLGFSLEEIAGLLRLEEPRACATTHDLALDKLADIEARLADLKRIRRTLKNLVAQCENIRGRVTCPIISTLSDGAEWPSSKRGAKLRSRREPR